MAKELWCTRCESERDWSEIEQRGMDAESQYCPCGAFCGPGSDEMLLIGDMSPEDRADIEQIKREQAEARTGGVIPPGFPTPHEQTIQGLDATIKAITDPPPTRAMAVRNDTGGVDIVITVGPSSAQQMSGVGQVINRAMADALLPRAASQIRTDRAISAPIVGEVITIEHPDLAPSPDHLAPYAEAGRALLGSLKPISPEAVRRMNGPLPDTVARRFDAAMDSASRTTLPKPAEPTAKPHMVVPSPAQKEATIRRDAATIASLWEALRPKG